MLSVLIPSRNRLDLLKMAVQSVLLQDFDDFEIVVSDNASSEDYGGYLESLGDPRIRYIRSDTPLSVTNNWNRALEAARGDYVVMLGDDDALAPGYLRHQVHLIETFNQPDVLYAMCYHYAYPGVIDGAPDGYLATVDNSILFRGHNAPYELDEPAARRLGRIAASFRHQISFNAQHYMYRRAYISSLSALGPFYQSPYPDYYTSFLTFLTAPRIVADPHPRMIIGIAKQSFGFFFMNQREEEGRLRFLGDPIDHEFLSGGDAATLEAIDHPGVDHMRNWLLASLQLKRRLAGTLEVDVDLRRYGRLQTMEMAVLAGHEGRARRADYYRFMRGLSDRNRAFARRTLRAAMTIKRLGADSQATLWRYRSLLNIYYPAAVQNHPITDHADILDAVRWLTPRPVEAAPPDEAPIVAPPDPQHVIDDLTARILDRETDLTAMRADHQMLIEAHAELGALRSQLEQSLRDQTEVLAEVRREGDRLSADLTATQTDRQTLAETHAELQALRSRLEQSLLDQAEVLAEALREGDRLSADLAATQQSKQTALEREEQTARERDQLLATRDALEQSLAWRATKSLRAILSALDRPS